MRLLLILVFCVASVLAVLSYDLKYNKEIHASYSDLLPATKKQIDCLAQNVYYEAGM